MTKDKKVASLGNFFYGIVSIATGIGAYFWFARLEMEGGNIRTHALIIALYDLFGKWGLLILLCVLGLVFIGAGVKGLMSRTPAQTSDLGEEELTLQ